MLVILITLLLAVAGPLTAQVTDRARLVAALDSAARAHVEHPMVAGVSVGVVRGSDTLLMRGYGLADIEWEVPTPADASASYEIGSVTKQFTAAAVMKLVEQGRLDLDADITTWLPDFDTRGHHVPLRRLLDHTSGIKGYTEMEAFGDIAAEEWPRDSLVALIENQPFEFEPGSAAIYNNSAYFLLGLIIEKVSGKSYEDFVREQLFEPAGMRDSYYCSESALRKHKAHGYDGSPDGLTHKGLIDHIWPFAAGSLCSTVPDLVRWNAALHGGRLLAPASYQALVTPVPLVDGSPHAYAMGLLIGTRAGQRVIAHGGGINGYLSDARWFPDDELLVVVLQNSTGPQGPDNLADAMIDQILGPVPPPVARPFTGSIEALDALTGEYAGPARGRHVHLTVSRDGEQLVVQWGDGEPVRPVHTGDGVWTDGGTRYRFVMNADRALELRVMQGAGHYVLRRVR